MQQVAKFGRLPNGELAQRVGTTTPRMVGGPMENPSGRPIRNWSLKTHPYFEKHPNIRTLGAGSSPLPPPIETTFISTH